MIFPPEGPFCDDEYRVERKKRDARNLRIYSHVIVQMKISELYRLLKGERKEVSEERDPDEIYDMHSMIVYIILKNDVCFVHDIIQHKMNSMLFNKVREETMLKINTKSTSKLLVI
jgi:hypothetical protein